MGVVADLFLLLRFVEGLGFGTEVAKNRLRPVSTLVPWGGSIASSMVSSPQSLCRFDGYDLDVQTWELPCALSASSSSALWVEAGNDDVDWR